MQPPQPPPFSAEPQYIPLPLLFPPLELYPGFAAASEAIGDPLVRPQRESPAAAAAAADPPRPEAAAAAAASGLRQQLLQRMQQLSALHQLVATEQQLTVCQRPTERPPGPFFTGDAENSAAAAAAATAATAAAAAAATPAAQRAAEAAFTVTPRAEADSSAAPAAATEPIAGAAAAPEPAAAAAAAAAEASTAFRASLPEYSPLLRGPSASEGPQATHPSATALLGAPQGAPQGSPLGAPQGLSEGSVWMQRQAHALRMADMYEGQLRLWHSFARLLQLQLLQAVHEEAAANKSSSSSSGDGVWPLPGAGPTIEGPLAALRLAAANAAASSSSSSMGGSEHFAAGRLPALQTQQQQQGSAAAAGESQAATSAAAAAASGESASAPSTPTGGAAAAGGGAQQQQEPRQDQQQQQQQQQQGAPWRLRFMVMYLKLLVLLFLFDANKWVYVSCLFVALLHANGAFNPLMELISSTSHRQPFEATLAQLRRRRERRPLQRLRLQQQRLHASVGRPFDGGGTYTATEDTTTPHTGETAASSSNGDSSSGSNSSSSSSSSNSSGAWASAADRSSEGLQEVRMRNRIDGGAPSVNASSPGAPEGPLSSRSGFEGPPEGAHRPSPGLSGEGRVRREREGPQSTEGAPLNVPPYWQRALYQGVAMFFLTTIPSWNPNPEMLIDYEGLEEEERSLADEADQQQLQQQQQQQLQQLLQQE